MLKKFFKNPRVKSFFSLLIGFSLYFVFYFLSFFFLQRFFSLDSWPAGWFLVLGVVYGGLAAIWGFCMDDLLGRFFKSKE